MSIDGNTSSMITDVSSLTYGWQLTSVLNSCGLWHTCLTSGPHSQRPTALWAPIMTF